MRILAVTNMYPSPANHRVGTFVEQQVSGLRRLGIEVEVLVIDRVTQGRMAYRATGRLVAAAIADHRPDLLHVMYGGVMGWLALRRSTVPNVLSFCGTDLLGERSGSLQHRARAHLGVWCSRRSILRADHVVVKSENLARALPRSLEPARFSVIPNGIDLERFQPRPRSDCTAELGWDAEPFHVLFCAHGPDDANKRYGLARRAVDELRDRGTPAELHLLSDRPHDEVPTWLNAADAVLVTSIQEGSPNIVKEALACDRPVVSVDVGDVAARIAGVVGCFIAQPDPADLAEALSRVTTGPGRVEGRESVRELSIESVAGRLIEIYRRVQAERGN